MWHVLGASLAACAALAGTNPATARTVEYLQTMSEIRTAADDQGIEGPFSETPAAGAVKVILDAPEAADHRVIVASVYCQLYKIDNPVSILLRDLVEAVDRRSGVSDGTDGQAVVTLRLISGSTVLRCMGKNDVTSICKNRVKISAEASFRKPDGALATVPLVAQVEREGRVGGFCGNIARYTGIITREAAIDLIGQLSKVTETQGRS